MAPRKKATAPARGKKAVAPAPAPAKVKKAPIKGRVKKAGVASKSRGSGNNNPKRLLRNARRGARAGRAVDEADAQQAPQPAPGSINDDPDQILRKARKEAKAARAARAAQEANAQQLAPQPAPGPRAESPIDHPRSGRDEESQPSVGQPPGGMVPRPSIAGGEPVQRQPKKVHKRRTHPNSNDLDPGEHVHYPLGVIPSDSHVQLREALARYNMKVSNRIADVVLKKLENDLELPELGAGERWVPARTLGKGGYGRARLFERRDAELHIIDSLVVKDCAVASWSLSGAQSFWYPNDTDRTRRPVEVEVMNRLRIRQSTSPVKYCAVLRKARIVEEKHFYQLYMDFYPNGTLEDVRKGHADAGQMIPEPIIWGIFDGLVTGCEYMSLGHPDPNMRVDTTPIVHRDLKHANIFLKAKSDGQMPFPGVWTPVIGDFGMAVFTSKEDVRNPFSLSCGGTDRWIPPEQLGMYDHETMEQLRWLLSEKTNIWVVGLMILRLMSLREAGSDNTGEENFASHEPYIRPAEKEKYSPELCTVVRRCLISNLQARIGLVDLRRAIDDNTGGPYASGVDRAENARLVHAPADFTFAVAARQLAT